MTPVNFGTTEARNYNGKLIPVSNTNESLEFDFIKTPISFVLKETGINIERELHIMMRLFALITQAMGIRIKNFSLM